MSHDLKDKGERVEFTTGMIREPNDGRGRYDLISPIMLRRLAILYERGAEKYTKKDETGNVISSGERNWEKGGKLSRFLNSAIRHIQQYLEGYRDEDHIIQAIWNLTSIVHITEMIERDVLPKELDDLPNYLIEEKPLNTTGYISSSVGIFNIQPCSNTVNANVLTGAKNVQ